MLEMKTEDSYSVGYVSNHTNNDDKSLTAELAHT